MKDKMPNTIWAQDTGNWYLSEIRDDDGYLEFGQEQYTRTAKVNELLDVVKGALKNLSFMAQTSGGVAGTDSGLVAAVENAEQQLEAINEFMGGDDE